MQHFPITDDGWIEGRGYRKQVLVREQDLRCPGALVQIVEIHPRTAVPFHYHKTSVEVFHILAGEGSMTIGGTEHFLSPGQTITCEPLEPHNARNDSDVPWRYIVFKTNVSPEDSYWIDPL